MDECWGELGYKRKAMGGWLGALKHRTNRRRHQTSSYGNPRHLPHLYCIVVLLSKDLAQADMEDDLLLVILTIKALWPPNFSFPHSISGLVVDWSCWIAAYRLATVFSALLE